MARQILTFLPLLMALSFGSCSTPEPSPGEDSGYDAEVDTGSDAKSTDVDSGDSDHTGPDLSWWDYEAGESVLGASGFVEFVPGDTPVVISASHGGYMEPDEVADRDSGTTVRDAYTKELTYEIGEAFYELTGKRPHLIVNLLARTKLDANRDIDEAAQGDPVAEEAWHEYHDFIDQAERYATTRFDRALYLDIHGHGHLVQRVELGYLLSASELREDDDVLDDEGYADDSSIRTLYEDNSHKTTFSELLRGPHSYGALLEARDFPSVPSDDQAAPKPLWLYFSGGYNTRRWGSIDESPMSGIQIEANQDARFDEDIRLEFAYAVAESSIEYLEHHYGIDLTK